MKLLISDLDGTLYPKKNGTKPTQLADNMKAVKRWVEHGNQFAVATARGFHHCPVLRERMGFDVNFIGCNGAMVRLQNGKEIIKQFPCNVFIDVCRFLKENNINASAATGIKNQWIWSWNDRYPRGETMYAHIWDDIVIADLDALDPDYGLERVQIFTPSENRDTLRKQLEDQNYPVWITTSDDHMIDMGPLNCDKGIAIKEMCQYYGLSIDDVIVVGDSENDMAMFNVTKHSYCIDSAEAHVLAAAAHHVASVEELIDIELAKTA